MLCQKWECSGCGQIFTESRILTKHLREGRVNDGKTKIICNGDKIKAKMRKSDKVFYGGNTHFSYAGCQWIEAQSEKIGKHIHHALCCHGEERVVPIFVKTVDGKDVIFIKVDGYEPESKTVYISSMGVNGTDASVRKIEQIARKDCMKIPCTTMSLYLNQKNINW